MNIGLREELEKTRKRYVQAREKARSGLENAPEGSLRLGKSQGCVQYYHCLPDGSHNGKYVSKNKMGFIKSLAQKSYDERILKLATKRIAQIDRLLKDYRNDEIAQCYLREHPERQKLITPVEETYQQKLDMWIARPYKGKEFKADAPMILTNTGMRVRSKSEKILADYFDSMNILYKYECPLYLRPYGIIYPDFTFLSPKTGQEIFWEHEGMMDTPDYARAAVKKIELYEKNGIYPGEGLLLSFETAASVINTNLIKEMTEKYLL